MGISLFPSSAVSISGENNFVLSTNSNTSYTLDRTYASGAYDLTFSDNDSTFDIYAVDKNGVYAGYTNSTVLQANSDFAKIVVLGADPGTTISFIYNGSINQANSVGDIVAAGAFINAVDTPSLPDIDDFTVISGGNFAPDVVVSFIGQDSAEIFAKAVSRSSSTHLLVTRPDDFSPNNSPYTIKVANPGIPEPISTNSHFLNNAVTAGTNPVWSTPETIYYNLDGLNSIELLATDTEDSDISYSLVSGTLPVGLALNGSGGTISGTFSGNANDGDTTSIEIRATDSGGNFLDKTFNFIANASPSWSTPGGPISPDPEQNVAYSYQLSASSGSAGGTLTYTIQAGLLPTGLTLSSTGQISGSAAGAIGDTSIFTVRATDELGLFVDREFSLTLARQPVDATVVRAAISSSGGWGYSGGNSDAIGITFTGDVLIRGLRWNPAYTGGPTIPNEAYLEAWTGQWGSGTRLASKNVQGRNVNTSDLLFNTPVSVSANTTVYIGIVWTQSQSNFQTYTVQNPVSSFTNIAGEGIDAEIIGAAYTTAPYSSNGTSQGGGQINYIYITI